MASSPESSQGENTYVIDGESGAEMARLLEQDRIVTQGMGGLFPAELDLSGVEYVLDIACGPGGWASEVAFAHPKVEVTGIDISQKMIGHAQAQAKAQGLDNVRFRVMDILKPLDFPDHSFDLVNARFLFAAIPKVGWPLMLRECQRVTRPGGLIRLTECELPLTNSPALEKLEGIFTRALYVSGHSFSPDGRLVGIIPFLGRLLQEAGYEEIQKVTYGLDFSAGTADYYSFYHDWEVAFKLVQPFLIKTGVATQGENDRVYQQMLLEMYADTFSMIWVLLSAWGKKP